MIVRYTQRNGIRIKLNFFYDGVIIVEGYGREIRCKPGVWGRFNRRPWENQRTRLYRAIRDVAERTEVSALINEFPPLVAPAEPPAFYTVPSVWVAPTTSPTTIGDDIGSMWPPTYGDTP